MPYTASQMPSSQAPLWRQVPEITEQDLPEGFDTAPTVVHTPPALPTPPTVQAEVRAPSPSSEDELWEHFPEPGSQAWKRKPSPDHEMWDEFPESQLPLDYLATHSTQSLLHCLSND